MDFACHTDRHSSRRLRFGGHVQGVGFRPFVDRAARQYGITGSVCNTGGEVEIIAQGPAWQIGVFLHHVLTLAPLPAKPLLLRDETIHTSRYDNFTILESRAQHGTSIHLPPDQSLCDDCLRELEDPSDRRYRYPFINCTRCGPRYTIIHQLPYDRANTVMASFPLCGPCSDEYHDAGSRRYHAEPVACPVCGPVLSWRHGDNETITGSHRALHAAVTLLRTGGIVAVKGIGGYHLMCDARNENAVATLRQRKQRPAKPLAVMFPWRGAEGMDLLQGELVLDSAGKCRLVSRDLPIVLFMRHSGSTLAESIAPGLSEIGVLLPYSPLHHQLLDLFGAPLVATSGNASGEPVITRNEEAEEKLGTIADAFLHHNRPILRPADDSVFRTIAGVARPLRLGRGVTPMELRLPRSLEQPVLAVGAHIKNSIALAWDDRIVLSPYIGDLDTPRGMQLFNQLIVELQELYNLRAESVIHDAHPDYASTRWSRLCGLPLTSVLHHHAHASALYGEHQREGDCIIFTWDGSGYGGDGTLWGGETFIGAPGRWQRFATLLPFRLPGGGKAARQPWRTALALCWEAGREWSYPNIDTSLLLQAWQNGLNTPSTSSIGRLFDGAAALLGLIHDASHEGEAAARLESCAIIEDTFSPLPRVRENGQPWLIDWQPMLEMLLDNGRTVGQRAGAFHQILADTLVSVAQRARRDHGISSVGLCGGVFQNKLLTTLATERLRTRGFEVMLSTQLPCNDGAIAYGQVIEYLFRQQMD